MKRKLFACLATSLFAASAFAQQSVLVGPGVNNGDLEAADQAPWGPDGGSISTERNLTDGGSQSLEIDLTANNGAGQWKGIGNAVVDVDPERPISFGLWMFIPTATQFGDTTNIFMDLETTSDEFANVQNGWANNIRRNNSDLRNEARDQWIVFEIADAALPEGTTQARTRGANINTTAEVNGKEAFNPAPPEPVEGEEPPEPDLTNTATPADWMAAGWDGSLFIDDIFIIQNPAPEEGVAIGGSFRNGDMEANALTPFKGNEYGSINTEFNNTTGGSQSFAIDIGFVSANQWKGLTNGNDVVAPAQPGQIVTAEAFVYVPTSTVFGSPEQGVARFTLNINDAAPMGNGEFGFKTQDLTTLERDTWHRVDVEAVVPEGTTSVNTNKWFITTVADPDVQGYSGVVLIDDVQLRVSNPPGDQTLIGGDINNGNLEAATLAPFSPGAISTEFNNTAGGSQSLELNLQSQSDFRRWKGLNSGVNSPIVSGTEVYSVSAFVYVPGDAQLGNDANEEAGTPNFTTSIALGLRAFALTGGQTEIPGGLFQDLKAVDRDSWVFVEAVDQVAPATNDNGAIVRVDTSGWNFARTDEPNGVDAASATSADWAAVGYSGNFYIDDVTWEVTRPAPPREGIFITDITYEEGVGVTITFDSTFESVALFANRGGDVGDLDAYDELVNDDFATSPVTDANADPNVKTFYIVREFE